MQPTDNISFTYEQVQALGEKVKSGSPLQGYWGDLTYYSEWIIGWSTESANECTINSVDGNKLDAFVAEYGREGESNQVDFDYESGNWQFWGEEERIEIPTAEMLSRTGIDVAVNEGADWAYMNLRKKVTVNTESETVTKTLKTKAEFYSLCSTGIPGYFATIDGQQIPNQAFKNFLVNSTPKNPDLTYIPHFFLDSSENLESVNIYQTILSVGNNFCSACTKLVSLSISGNITVGNQFCHSCSSLTSASNVRCTKVGNGFFAYTGVTYLGDTSIIEEVGSGFFSHTPQLQATNISFPVLTKMGDQFLADSGVGNNGSLTFNFPILGNIPDFFLADCTNFVLLTLNAPLLKSIGAYFCSGCSALQGILAFPSSVTSVGRGFFYNDTSLYFMSTTLKDNVNVITEFQNLETV